MGGLNSIKDWQKNKLAKNDLIHLTYDGYNLIGDLLFEAFIKSFINYKKIMGDFSIYKFFDCFLSPFLKSSEHPMIFTEYPFWIFFLFVISGYRLVYKKLKITKYFSFLVSLYFYFKTSGFFFSILLFSTNCRFLI